MLHKRFLEVLDLGSGILSKCGHLYSWGLFQSGLSTWIRYNPIFIIGGNCQPLLTRNHQSPDISVSLYKCFQRYVFSGGAAVRLIFGEEAKGPDSQCGKRGAVLVTLVARRILRQFRLHSHNYGAAPWWLLIDIRSCCVVR
jgi:hypothetical protein